MQNLDQGNWVKVYPGVYDAGSIMRGSSLDTIKAILRRIGADCPDGFPKETYIDLLRGEMYEDNTLLIKIIPKDMLTFLLETWENDEVEMTGREWDYVQYLKIFGFLTYQKGPLPGMGTDKIFVESELRDDFYFLFKGRNSARLMRRYDDWEKLIGGLIYYYGLIPMRKLHAQFMELIREEIDYGEFAQFVRCRAAFWTIGLILKDIRTDEEYFQSANVSNAEILLLCIRQHADLKYKLPARDDLYYISEGGGVDNRWQGISELGTLLTEEVRMSYYPATVFVKTMIDMVQNGRGLDEIDEKADMIRCDEPWLREKVKDAARLLYESAPLFELKGFSRREYRRMEEKRRWAEKKKLFHLITNTNLEGKHGQ